MDILLSLIAGEYMYIVEESFSCLSILRYEIIGV
jgi:hypothetical protein